MNEGIIRCPVCNFSVDIHGTSEWKQIDIVDIVNGVCHGD